MYAIKKKEQLNKSVFAMEIEAPLVARAAKPGQFIILRVDYIKQVIIQVQKV